MQLSIILFLQCWIILLSACADNGDVDLAAAIHRFLLSRNGPLSRQVQKESVLLTLSRSRFVFSTDTVYCCPNADALQDTI